MNIGVFNLNEKFKKKLSSYKKIKLIDITNKDTTNLDKIFIDYVSKDSKLFGRQAEIVNKYIKKVPFVVYDRKRSMNNKEFNYLRKFKTKFYEPYVITRSCFEYLPEGIEIPSDLPLFTEDRDVTLAYHENIHDKMISVDKYYDGSPTVVEDFSNIRGTIIIGSKEHYEYGYLDPYFWEAMNQGCVPLLPEEHKWFHCLFEDTVLRNDFDKTFALNNYKGINYGTIVKVYKAVEETFPEMLLDNVVSKLYRSLV